jgi:hypothetical protein
LSLLPKTVVTELGILLWDSEHPEHPFANQRLSPFPAGSLREMAAPNAHEWDKLLNLGARRRGSCLESVMQIAKNLDLATSPTELCVKFGVSDPGTVRRALQRQLKRVDLKDHQDLLKFLEAANIKARSFRETD